MKTVLFYADFLGTTDQYESSVEQVVLHRETLEMALEAIFLPILEENDARLYVFSDSVMVICKKLDPLLGPIARLFDHCLDLTLSEGKDTSHPRLLRGAISYGESAESWVLQKSDRVTVIPFLGDCIPKAYKLERIRKGSRVFIHPEFPEELRISCDPFATKWKQITGRGPTIKNVIEFNWPARRYADDPERFKSVLKKLRARWLKQLGEERPDPKEYNKGLVHLDETIKLIVRSILSLPKGNFKNEDMLQLLPQDKEDFIDARYEWGLWFQIIRVVLERSKTTGRIDPETLEYIMRVKSILIAKGRWDHFLTERLKEDYQEFKVQLDDVLQC